MKKTYVLNTVLAVVVFAAAMVAVIVRAFAPAVIIPGLDVPNVAMLSLIALVLDHYLAKGARRCYVCIPVFSAITSGLLPWAAGFTTPLEAAKLALIGGITFTVITLLFTAMTDRISSGPVKKLSPVVSAVGLWLAVQCFAGIF